MNDDEIDKLFAQIDAAPEERARERALAAALQVFDDMQADKKSNARIQGSDATHRPTPEHQSFGSKIMGFLNTNSAAQRWLYSGVGSAAVLIAGVFIAVQLPQNSGWTPSGAAIEPELDRKSMPLEPAVDVWQFAAEAPVSMAGAPAPRQESLQAPKDMTKRQAASGSAVFDAVEVAAVKSMVAESDTAGRSRSSDTQHVGRDRFESVASNAVKRVSAEPVSTFSIDVDTASYSFVRRQLNRGVLPQKAAVRLEEMVNYFPYDYPLPEGRSQPFSTSVTVTDSPWKAGNKLVRLGIQGYDIEGEQPRSNLVFLLDVSGSMNSPDKLPLVKQAMSMLLSRLRPEDTVAIVVYAGAAGTVLEPTPVKERQKILSALNRLQAGGATAGAAGIQQAYQLAESQWLENGVNRIILATDGDFNVGINNTEELRGFVERKRESGVFLSVLGFGEGNYQDALMQTLAQNGNGTAAYIDTLGEAQKVLVEEATSSLFPIAKDVKIQVEFNPATVSEYRLLGYETRMLAQEDFNNDAVDAGDIGAGHSVTAIYEITPVGSDSAAFSESRYQDTALRDTRSGEYGYLKLRYKLPGDDTSHLISEPITTHTAATAQALRETAFATAVAGFAQLLQGGKYLADWDYADALALAQASRGEDPFGYRAEFVQLVRKAEVAAAM